MEHSTDASVAAPACDQRCLTCRRMGELDAAILGNVAVALYAPLPADHLRQLVRRRPSLTAWCERLVGTLFAPQVASDSGPA